MVLVIVFFFCSLLSRSGPQGSSDSGSQDNLERSSLSMEDNTPVIVSFFYTLIIIIIIILCIIVPDVYLICSIPKGRMSNN